MKKAVSGVITCEDFIYVGKRLGTLNAFPGYHAFPAGGRVEQIDKEDEFLKKHFPEYDQINLAALNRELKEEVGYSLVELLESGFLESLTFLGIAEAPPFNQVRFSSSFFEIRINKKLPFKVSEHEFEEASWMKGPDLFNLWNAGKAMMVPPTLLVVENFAKGKLNEKLPFGVQFLDSSKVHWIEPVSGIKILFPLSNTFPPANRTNCFYFGDDDSKKILVDPSPKNQEEFEKLKNTLSEFKVDEIFITHHHPDHHEMAKELSLFLKVPLSMGEKTKSLIDEKYGPEYLKNANLILVDIGSTLTKWKGENVEVIHVPGHDSGQLALAPKSMEWYLVSDLIQTIGTVVVGGKEGNMAHYFESLEKVISSNPLFIFPSHGMPLGGTHKLKMTLEHRKMREKQVKQLLAQGKGPNEILEVIYKGLEEGLKKYALKTIDAHIDKIKSEEA